MKKLLSLLLTVIMVLSMVSVAFAEEAVKITVFHYMVEGQKADGMVAIQEEFKAKYPDVNIEFENLAYSQGTDFWPQLETAIAAGDNPEIIMGNPGLYSSLIEEGYIMDLTGNETIKSLGLTDGDMGDVSYQGKWYAYPVDFKSWGVFYNVKMFKELGIEVPSTKTELLAVCQKLYDNSITPWAQWYADGASVDIEMRPIVWTEALANGDKDMFAKLMSGEKKIAEYPYFAKGLQEWADRMGSGWAANNATSNKQTDANEMFVSGKAGMLYQGTWNIGSIEQMIAGTDFEYGFFLCPMDDSGNTPVLNVQVDQAFMVNDKADQKEWAAKFMEFWLTDCMGMWSDFTYQPCITGATTENTPELLRSLLAAKASGNTACYGDFTAPFSSAFTAAYRKALTAWAVYCCTGQEASGVNSVDTCIQYMQTLFDEEIAKNAL
ncbi:MAG: carbohydrate ABC transporter substrate-binding protein [Clostridiales bacterium]|nr:carbohydrate ABC transporter substrate-binding protein [Clostridiales bacterium]